MIRAAALLVPLTLLACAPVPMTPDRAARLCQDEANQADGISGSIGVGIGTGGPRARSQITVTNKVFNPRPRQEVLQECIARRMSGAPTPTPTTFGVTLGGRL